MTPPNPFAPPTLAELPAWHPGVPYRVWRERETERMCADFVRRYRGREPEEANGVMGRGKAVEMPRRRKTL